MYVHQIGLHAVSFSPVARLAGWGLSEKPCQCKRPSPSATYHVALIGPKAYISRSTEGLWTSSDGFTGRRRKIRCIFPPDNPNVCSECFARGSRCIDQEHAAADVIVDHRKNLRERVSRLEALVDSLLEEHTDKDPAETVRDHPAYSDPLPPTPLSSEASSSAPGPIPTGHSGTAPLLSVFEDAVRVHSPL
jgi:hypothetical protein